MTALNSASANNQPPATHSLRGTLGVWLTRLLVPVWILAGAAVKLWERNPQLLPKPVTTVTDLLFVDMLGISRERYLDPAMRAMIAVEIAVVIAMIFGPITSARRLGIGILLLFTVILSVLIASGAASCGCFGASGPSPGWMLAVDGSLLVALIACTPHARSQGTSASRSILPTAILGILIGAGVAFGVPARKQVVLEPQVVDTSLQAPGTTPPTNVNPTAPSIGAWPAMPATAKPWYAPEFANWKGQRLDQQELMLLVGRPLPADLNTNRHHIVFIREDCDHCHELLNSYFSGVLETPTITVVVPDATGELLENPCSACGKAALPKGITYVFSTPVLLTVQDGVVVGVCTNSDDPALVRAALNAK